MTTATLETPVYTTLHAPVPTSARHAKGIEVSRRIRWDIDRDVIRGRTFDLVKKVLPDGLSANKLPRNRRVLGASRWLLLLALSLGGSGSAFAAPCAGFVDVDTASAYCGNVEWMKNRAITLGCTAFQYCPDEPVGRLQMAAFMNRLGKALQPVFLYAQDFSPSFPGQGETILCQVGSVAAAFPRIASPASVSVTLNSPGAAAAFAALVVSFDNGATWTYWSNWLSTFPSNTGGVHSSQSPSAPPLAVAAGQTVRFGIQPLKASGGPAIDEASCELTVRIDNGG